jgi:hypothetical protein
MSRHRRGIGGCGPAMVVREDYCLTVPSDYLGLLGPFLLGKQGYLGKQGHGTGNTYHCLGMLVMVVMVVKGFVSSRCCSQGKVFVSIPAAMH